MSHVTEACCVNPPVLGEEYKPVGKNVKINGLDVYAVGSSDATKGVMLIYDALGPLHQVHVAADLLASLMPNTLIVMPDFFKGEAIKFSAFQLPEEERKEVVTRFLTGPANPDTNIVAAKGVLEHAKDAGFAKVKAWGAFGLCWGGAMTAKLSGPGTPFVVAGTAHPGQPNPDEAAAFVIPYICLFSPEDGPLEKRQAYEKALDDNKVETYVETYEDRVHGWMGARCDFKDEKARAEFERGYKKAAEFFGKHL